MYVSRQKPRLEAVSRQQKCCSASLRRFDASPRSCLGLNIITSKLRYDIIIHNFHQVIFRIHVFKTFKTKLHQCIKQRFQMRAKRVRCACVLPREFASARFLKSQLLRLGLVNAASASVSWILLTHITADKQHALAILLVRLDRSQLLSPRVVSMVTGTYGVAVDNNYARWTLEVAYSSLHVSYACRDAEWMSDADSFLASSNGATVWSRAWVLCNITPANAERRRRQPACRTEQYTVWLSTNWLIDWLIDWLFYERHISTERLLVPRNVAK